MVTLGGLTNASGATLRVQGSAGHAADAGVQQRGHGFTSNAGSFELTYTAPLTLDNGFANSGNFGLHNSTALTVDGGFTNSGTLNVDNNATGSDGDGGSSLTIGGTLANTGTVQIGNGESERGDDGDPRRADQCQRRELCAAGLGEPRGDAGVQQRRHRVHQQRRQFRADRIPRR